MNWKISKLQPLATRLDMDLIVTGHEVTEGDSQHVGKVADPTSKLSAVKSA